VFKKSRLDCRQKPDIPLFSKPSRLAPRSILPPINAHQAQRNRGAKLTIHFHLMRGLRIRAGTVMHLPTLLSPARRLIHHSRDIKFCFRLHMRGTFHANC
jgi:hypothetical protein